MTKPQYDRRKVTRAMLIAPAVGLLGIAPFILQLNLSVVQFLLVVVFTLVIAYILGLIFGAPVYLLLKSLGYSQTQYLIGYAVLLALATPIVLDDIYAILVFGPPTLLAAAAFCYIRGPALSTTGPADGNA